MYRPPGASNLRQFHPMTGSTSMSTIMTRRFVTRFTLTLAITLAFLLPSSAWAQQARTISFDEAVTIALENNVNILRAQNNLDVQALTVTSEKADFLPNLNLSTSGSRNYGLFIDNTTFQQRNTITDGMSFNASSGINLFNGFSDIAGVRSAEAQLEGQEFAFERTKQTVVFNVIQSYLNVIVARENIRVREEDVAAQQRSLDQIQEFVNVGTRPISDLYQQQATLANSEAQLLTAESNYQLAQTRLIQVMQLDPLGEYAFETPSVDEIDTVVRPLNAETMLRTAFELRPDLRSQEMNIESAAQNIRMARAGYMPSLSLSGSVGTSWSSARRELFTFSEQFENNRSERIGLSLNIPVFNRFNTKTNVERSKVQFANAQLDLENAQQNVALEVRQAYQDYLTAAKRLDVTEKQVTSAEQALRVVQERYNLSDATLVELTQAQSAFTNAASQRVQAVFQFHFQERLLNYYQGNLDPTQSLFD